MAFVIRGLIVEISTSQIGQNFAGINSNSANEVKNERSLSQTRIEENLNQRNLEKNSTPSAEDIQANSDSADNFQREGRSQDLDVAVQEIQSFLQVQNRNLAFSIDDDTKRSVVTVKDSSSGDVIRQIPSDEVLRLAERIKDLQQDIGSSVGVLLNNKV
ncbi:flagellar protein FlaG [Aestuariibacter sp. GS-14]|nr:flagellar protein FlaG [Aestuariibacter sp. GS-14]